MLTAVDIAVENLLRTGEVCEISQRLFADGGRFLDSCRMSWLAPSRPLQFLCVCFAGFLCAGSDAAVERLLQRARSSRGCKQAWHWEVAANRRQTAAKVQPVKLVGARLSARLHAVTCTFASRPGRATRR